jgi:hypothetical protein
MGMRLFDPPDVFGWPGGEDWVTTSRLLARAAFGNVLATNRSTTVGNRGIPVEQLLQTAGLGSTTTAEQVVDYFVSLLIQRRLALTVRQALVDYLKKNDAGVVTGFTLDATTIDKKVRGIILDMRSNPGGYMESAVDIASEWIAAGPIVRERDSANHEVVHATRGTHRLLGIPTVVLVDGGSASASEIVAGALQDADVATVVGQKTFGKGSVQDFMDLPDGSALKITIAKWLTPHNREINEKGIVIIFS